MNAVITSKDTLLEEIETEWAQLDALLRSLDPERLEAPLLAGEWTAKDVLAHIMSWEQNLIAWVGDLQSGQEPQREFTGNDWIDRVNERIFNEYHHVSSAEVREAFERSYQEVVQLVEALAPEALMDPDQFPWLQGTPLWRLVAQNTCWHYREHRESLVAALERVADEN